MYCSIRQSLFIAMALAVCVVRPCAGKTVDGSVIVKPGRASPITKFSFVSTDSPNKKSKITGYIKYKGDTRVKMYLFMDNKWWDQFHNPDLDVCDKMEEATTEIRVGDKQSIVAGVGVATHDETKMLPHNYREWHFTWEVHHAVRTYGWYVVLADCTDGRRKVQKLDYHLELYNPGDVHLPADEFGLPTVYFCTLLLMGAYGVRVVQKVKQNAASGEIHLAIKLFLAAYVLQLTSLFFEVMHLRWYSMDGYGSWTFDFFSEVLEGMSQTTLSFLLLCLASGWTLTQRGSSGGGSLSSSLRDPQSLMRPENPAILLLFFVPVILMILQFFNKWQDENFLKFHDHESIAGKILVLFRAVLGVVYIRSLHATLKQQEVSGGATLIQFLRKLQMFGSLWFVVFPLLVFVAGFFAHYLRHRIVTGGVLVLQTGCLLALAEQFLSESSSYFRISSISSYGFLPGAGGGHFTSFAKDKSF